MGPMSRVEEILCFFFLVMITFFVGGVLNEGSVDKWSGKHVGSFRVW